MQLDLLGWQPSASVVPFPASKRVGKIRHVAMLMHRREVKERPTYWKRITDDMMRQMLKSQVPPALVGPELSDFENAVVAEMRRLDLVEKHKGGAA